IYHVTLNKDYWGGWNPELRDAAFHVAKTGKAVVEGKGTNRKFLNWDNLVFLPGQLKYPPLLDTEPVNTKVVIGPNAKKPIVLETPVLIGAMSFGSLSIEAKEALALGARAAGSMSNTGEGGMHERERAAARFLTLQYSTGRFGVDQEDLLLLADKITPEIAKVRNLMEAGARFRPGENAISPARHLDINSPEDLTERVHKLREITGGVPIAIKIAGGHVENDLAIATAAGPDVLVVDGGEGGTGAAPAIAKNHAGLPLVYTLSRALAWLKNHDLRDRFTLIAAGGLKGPADFAKVLAMGADAVYTAGYAKFGLGCVYCRSCESGRCPTGITTQDPALRKRLIVSERANQVANLLRVSTNEIARICRLCGVSTVADLGQEHLRSLTADLSRATGVAMAHEPCTE
ncbi:MAG: FMN-binding glutamate synthase family protein, partial [Deltaproteobacteria bacterium]|nr:FMN-binding glutamate synthase family protein [Deltaproteobacteria bacterium]